MMSLSILAGPALLVTFSETKKCKTSNALLFNECTVTYLSFA